MKQIVSFIAPCPDEFKIKIQGYTQLNLCHRSFEYKQNRFRFQMRYTQSYLRVFKMRDFRLKLVFNSG